MFTMEPLMPAGILNLLCHCVHAKPFLKGKQSIDPISLHNSEIPRRFGPPNDWLNLNRRTDILALNGSIFLKKKASEF
jgi:hypothetical protein